MAIYTSYDSRTKQLKEDLTDFITTISPDDTYFLSNVGRATAKSTLHEFMTDTLATPAANAWAEGADFTVASLTSPTRLNNYTQIIRKDPQITDTAEATDNAGMKSMKAYYTTKTSKEVARDIEYALLVNSAAASASAGSARTMKGVAGWITTNTATGTTGTANPFTGSNGEGILNTLLASMWDAGAKPQTILCGSANKRRISTFTANNTRWTAAGGKEVTVAVDLYKSDFGDLKVVPHYIMSAALTNTIFIFGDMELWKTAWLRPMSQVDLAKVGDSTRWMMRGELTLESRNEVGSGKITLS